MTTCFRAIVMLGVLVGLPAAWVYYGPLPDRAQRVVDRFVAAAREAAGLDRAAAESQAAASASLAPAFTIGDGGGDALADPFGAPPPFQAPPAAAAEQPAARPLSAAAAPGAAAAPSAGEIEPMLEQLRQLGAAGYALEKWGSGGSYYRFHCEMPLQGQELTQQFEAIAAEPRATIAQVLSEVVSWRAARDHVAQLR